MPKSVNVSPSRYSEKIDKINSKLKQKTLIFGKPNVLVNDFGIDGNGKFVPKTLSEYSIKELVQIATTFSPGKPGQSQAIKKIFLEIEKAENENEYNRTQVANRKEMLSDIMNRYRMDLN